MRIPPTQPAAAVFLSCLGLVACSPTPEPSEAGPSSQGFEVSLAAPRPLPSSPSAATDRMIVGGEVHEYSFTLAPGEGLILELLQREGDVYIELSTPRQDDLPRIDSSLEATDLEPVVWIAESGGRHVMRIGSFSERSVYSLQRIERRSDDPELRIEAEAHWSFFEARALRRIDAARSAENYARAIERWQRLGSPAKVARARFELGEILRQSEPAQAVEAYLDACSQWQKLGDRRQEARCRHRLGGLYSREGKTQPAAESYSRALVLWKEVGDRHEASVLAFDLAHLHRKLGRPEDALDLLDESLRWAEHHADPITHQAKIRSEKGALYQYRGEIDRGLREYRIALKALADHPQRDSRNVRLQIARTKTRLGSALPRRAGATSRDFAEAHRLLLEARALRTGLEDKRGFAVTTNSLGLLYERWNRPRDALRAFEQAWTAFRELQKPGDAAVVQANRCRILDQSKKHEIAWKCYLEASEELQKWGYRNAQAHTLTHLAENARNRGRLAEARRWSLESIEKIELIRKEAGRSDFRSSVIDSRYDSYQLLVDITLALHAEEPQSGHAEAAFKYVENARARSLLESLGRFQGDLKLGPEGRRLKDEIHRLRLKQLGSEEDLEDSGDDIRGRLEEALEDLRSRNPYHAVAEPKILSAREAQRLLGPGTLLLAYHLGATQSGVWAITDSEFSWHTLSSRADIETLVRRFHQSAGRRPHRIRGRSAERHGRELSEALLGSVREQLEQQSRIVVVPDGVLSYVPFAALPLPGSSPTSGPLVERLDTSYLPSISVLAALRRRESEREGAGRALTLVAAPVLRSDDPRLRSSQSASTSVNNTDRPERIPFAATEAIAVSRLFDRESITLATGFRASREFVLGGGLRDARIVHFATHGHLDDTRGELSGLALSQFDSSGRRTKDFLWAYELYGLDLKADLVVLSACQTALGEDIRGEGLAGLASGFFYAGSSRVLASLWKVDDEATARLMELFYRGVRQERLSPARALRRAQIELKASGRSAPYYWAPFILLGDWRELPRPELHR